MQKGRGRGEKCLRQCPQVQWNSNKTRKNNFYSNIKNIFHFFSLAVLYCASEIIFLISHFNNNLLEENQSFFFEKNKADVENSMH